MVNFYMNRGTPAGMPAEEAQGGTNDQRKTLTELLDLVGDMTGVLLVAAHPERDEGDSAFKLACEKLQPMIDKLRQLAGHDAGVLDVGSRV
jgi:hypothetical protein